MSIDYSSFTRDICFPFLVGSGKTCQTSGHQQLIDHHFAPSRQRYQCDHCKAVFSHLYQLTKHSKTCKKFFCVTCKKTFYIERNFERHFKNCPPKRFPCHLCTKSFSRKGDCEKHISKHPKCAKTFDCPVCNCQCLTAKVLEIHVKQQHPLQSN